MSVFILTILHYILCYEKCKLPICNKFDSSQINIKFILRSKVPVG